MKIVMVSDQYAPIIGGTERQCQKLATALVRRGHSVRVITGRWRSSMPDRESNEGVDLLRVSTLNSMGGLRGIRKFGQDFFAHNLKRAVRTAAQDADVVHCHFMRRGAVATLEALQGTDVPVLVKETSSGEYNSFSRLVTEYRGEWMRQRFFEMLRHVCVLNDVAAEDYARLPFHDLQIHKVVNGVDVEECGPVATPSLPQTILFLGRLHPIKGASELVRAFISRNAELSGWHLRICGDGPEAAGLRALSASSGCSDRIEFAGAVKDPREELRRASLLALPSRAEGMSNTLLEAMAMRVPVVASDAGANAEMLDGNCGWVYPALDEARLGEALVDACGSEGERGEKAARARERVETQYDFDVVAASFERLYASLNE